MIKGNLAPIKAAPIPGAAMFNWAHKKKGGLWFFRLGRFGGCFYFARK